MSYVSDITTLRCIERLFDKQGNGGSLRYPGQARTEFSGLTKEVKEKNNEKCAANLTADAFTEEGIVGTLTF